MSTAPTDDITDSDSRVAQPTPGYTYNKAKKRAGRGERERKSREAKWRARQAVQPEAQENTRTKRALKQHKLVKNKGKHHTMAVMRRIFERSHPGQLFTYTIQRPPVGK